MLNSQIKMVSLLDYFSPDSLLADWIRWSIWSKFRRIPVTGGTLYKLKTQPAFLTLFTYIDTNGILENFDSWYIESVWRVGVGGASGHYFAIASKLTPELASFAIFVSHSLLATARNRYQPLLLNPSAPSSNSRTASLSTCFDVPPLPHTHTSY